MDKLYHYKVIFICYQYNSGKADNGYYTLSQDFATLEDARKFKRTLIRIQHRPNTKYSRRIIEEFVYAGYLEKILGIYKVTEEKVE